ncbi:uncharacterized protein LOC113851404 [Abrus precatorius]|uniref:Uncharacterized protein LOC113851404 n=1 Tax=Abrus precatorius TaxID=3816 RepID=A0A8B8K1Z3_ABRPR|nr:uncharacterized protein LOC113851404 [Abrus precatorius]
MASQRCPHNGSHHMHHCPHCPLRRHCLHCPLHNPHFHLSTLSPLHTHPNSSTIPHYNQIPLTSLPQISQELKPTELDGEEADDEPVFVLTDEWREFFAKSEARRKLEKKQDKKGKK